MMFLFISHFLIGEPENRFGVWWGKHRPHGSSGANCAIRRWSCHRVIHAVYSAVTDSLESQCSSCNFRICAGVNLEYHCCLWSNNLPSVALDFSEADLRLICGCCVGYWILAVSSQRHWSAKRYSDTLITNVGWFLLCMCISYASRHDDKLVRCFFDATSTCL